MSTDYFYSYKFSRMSLEIINRVFETEIKSFTETTTHALVQKNNEPGVKFSGAISLERRQAGKPGSFLMN